MLVVECESRLTFALTCESPLSFEVSFESPPPPSFEEKRFKVKARKNGRSFQSGYSLGDLRCTGHDLIP